MGESNEYLTTLAVYPTLKIFLTWLFEKIYEKIHLHDGGENAVHAVLCDSMIFSRACFREQVLLQGNLC